MKSALASLLVSTALLLASPVAAQSPGVRAAIAQLDSGDAFGAAAALRPLADGGDLDALAWLGAALARRGDDAGLRESIEVLRRADAAGSAVARRHLALQFATGLGVPRDEARAADLYRSAADAGDVRSLYNLGVMTASGRGVARDPQRAQALWRDAAQRGDAYAPYALARTLEQGGGSPAEIARFDRMAAERGHLPAAARYGMALGLGRGVSRDEARAVAWLQHAADAGLPEAMAGLGDLAARSAAAMRPGREREQAQARALGWFRLAAEAGNAAAQHRYANALSASVASASAQPSEALIWQRRAAAQGDREAQYVLGVWMSGGVLGPKDPADGYRWLLLAQRQGQPDAGKVAAKARESLSAEELARAERDAARFAPVAERPRTPDDSWPLKIPARIP